MSIRILGNRNRIAFPLLRPIATSFGSSISYTEPSYDWCYSKYGFAISKNYEGVPYHILLDNKFPTITKTMSTFSQSYEYLLLDHSGELWIARIDPKRDEGAISFEYINRHSDGWWGSLEEDDDILLGMLKTKPSEELINEVYFEYNSGNRLEWFNIEDIVNKLNDSYPLSSSEIDDIKM